MLQMLLSIFSPQPTTMHSYYISLLFSFLLFFVLVLFCCYINRVLDVQLDSRLIFDYKYLMSDEGKSWIKWELGRDRHASLKNMQPGADGNILMFDTWQG